ncbi:MAG: response regulator transcription factor [Bacteroidetes bacterium]|nr:response regulator transcription factor [Bacteroidota bacterium]
MKKLRVIIADDELPALKLTESYVLQTPSLELISSCSSAAEVIEQTKNHTADLYLLDIQMPGMNGLELRKRLPDEAGVIFTTAFAEFAIEGFKANAIDYLLKPFDYDEFHKAIKKAQQRLERSNDSVDGFFVKTEYHLEKIRFGELLFAESNRDYIRLYLNKQQEAVNTQMTLKELEEQLPSDSFMRVHRSFIVNLHCIDQVEKNRIYIGKHQIPVAESYRNDFQNYIRKHTL